MVEQQGGGAMLQYMINGSRAVLTRPSVPVFEEYERDNVGWATIYVVIAAVIAGVCGLITTAINPNVAPQSGIIGGVVGTLVGFFIWLGLVYGIGRAFGGTGKFGELAFDISLFYAPLLVLLAVVNIIAIGPLSILTAIVAIAIALYQLYLTYLGIQSGMNLPSNKALYVIGILFLIGVVIVACIVGVAATVLSTMMNSANP